VGNEAQQVKSALEKQGFEVTVISNPNGSQLRNELKTFIDNYGYSRDNRLVIFFSGHGHTRNKTKGYLVPVDAPDPTINEQGFLKAALPMQQVMTWAQLIEAKHALFVFDSCFSGTIFKQRSSNSNKLAYINNVMNKPVRQFLTAGDAEEKVPAKSIFTPLFIRALEGEADYTKDGYVTGTELGLYLRQELSEYTKTQTPQFGTIRDPELDRGDVVFRVITPTPRTINVNPKPINPKTLTANEYYSRAYDYYAKGEYEKAIADYNQAIKLNPNDASAYYNRGLAHYYLKEYEKAIADYNQAIKLDPNHANAYYSRGFAYRNLKEYQKAIADFNQAIKLNPNDADAYYSRGLAYKLSGNNQNALSDFRQAATLYQQQGNTEWYNNAKNLIKELGG
jgi:tetratricopeptide (TPR) repeat protein